MKKLKSLHLKEVRELTRNEMQQVFGGYESVGYGAHM